MPQNMKHKPPQWGKKKARCGTPQGSEKLVIDRINAGLYEVTDDYKLYSVRRGRVVGARRGKGKPRNTMFVSEGKKLIHVEIARVMYAYFKGDIPQGYYVVCKDGNKENFAPENLILKTKAEVGVIGGKKSGGNGGRKIKRSRKRTRKVS